MKIINNTRLTDSSLYRLIIGGGFDTWIDKGSISMCWDAYLLENDNSIRMIL